MGGLENVPRSGLAIVTTNHPSGVADGFAVFDALKSVRRDIVIFANRDAIRAAPGLTDIIIPVEWRDVRRDHARKQESFGRTSRMTVKRPGMIIEDLGDVLTQRLERPTAVSLSVCAIA